MFGNFLFLNPNFHLCVHKILDQRFPVHILQKSSHKSRIFTGSLPVINNGNPDVLVKVLILQLLAITRDTHKKACTAKHFWLLLRVTDPGF